MKVSDNIDIYNLDCFELFSSIDDKSIDLVLTDPPFGMSFQSGYRKIKHEKILNDDNLDWLPEWCKEINRIVKDDSHLYIFCSWHKVEVFKLELEKYFKIKNILIWEKNNTGMGDLYGDYAPQYEMCIFINNGKDLNNGRHSNIIKAKRTNNELHPTQKPVNLMEFFITKSTKKEDMVLDTFAGSFSTAIACHNTGRRFIGTEINKEYYDNAVKRLKKLSSQITLF